MNDTYDHIPEREPLPTQVDVRMHSLHAGGTILADASVALNGCFVIRGVRVIRGPKGPFVAMPSFRSRKGYMDVCYPCTKEFYRQLSEAVLDAYRQEMAVFGQRQQDQWQEPDSEQEQTDPFDDPAITI